MNWEDRISVHPGVLVGKPVIKGTRIAVEFVVGLAANGHSVDKIAERYQLDVEDARACLLYAQRLVESERIVSLAAGA
jgi:uncharacterized protein (DUF433 family)